MIGEDNAEPIEKSLFESPPLAEQERMIEAMLFASATPLTLAEMQARMPHASDPAEAMVALRRRYEGRGVNLMRIGDAYAFRTAGDLGFLMSSQTVETRKLSRAAIETLAIVAYHQPVTRAEIEEIRGVAVSKGTIDQLMELDWIRLGRRRMTPGRPVTFVVTEGFLDHFGLESARDLPGIKELRAAGLLDSRPLPMGLGGTTSGEGEDQEDPGQTELFED
jgi:segregation and condensation protein B